MYVQYFFSYRYAGTVFTVSCNSFGEASRRRAWYLANARHPSEVSREEVMEYSDFAKPSEYHAWRSAHKREIQTLRKRVLSGPLPEDGPTVWGDRGDET